MNGPGDLHQLYLIADVETADRLEIDLVAAVWDFLRAGGRQVSLRGTKAADERLLRMSKEISGMVYSVGGLFLIHRRLDLVQMSVADGVHLPSKGFAAEDVRGLMGRSVLMGRSCHDGEEVATGVGQGLAFMTLGPVFQSVSKEKYGPALSLEEFGEITGSVEVPIYALGGVLPENARRCIEAGAAGVAVVGGILGAESVFDATESYLDALDAFSGTAPAEILTNGR